MTTSRRPASQGQQAALHDRPLFLVIDGHAVVHRAWAAIQTPLTIRATGEEVQGVYGFMNAFLKTLATWHPTHCAIAFDPPGPVFRHAKYAEYKAQRPEMPPSLRSQFPHVRQLMEAFGVPIFELKGYEADDVIGTLCRQAEAQSLETVILTGDTDMLQLVSPSVRVEMHSYIQRERVYDQQAVRERYGGLSPERQPDVKGLQGDTSDNIPGVPGIGAKTAVKLIVQFGSLETLYERLDEVTPPRIQELLRTHRDQAFLGKELTTIVRDAPVELDTETALFGDFDRESVLAVLRELEFSSMVGRIPQASGQQVLGQGQMAQPQAQDGAEAAGHTRPAQQTVPQDQPDYRTVDTRQALEAMVDELRSDGTFAFDTESTGQDPMNCDLVGLSFSSRPGLAYYVPVGHREGTQLPLGEALEALKPLLEDPKLDRIAHKATYDMTLLRNYDINVPNVAFDTMVAAQLSGYNTLGLKQLAFQLLNVEMTPIADLIGRGAKQITMAEAPIADAALYAAADADMTGRLHTLLKEELGKHGVETLFTDVEMPLVPVLVQMQLNGITVDQGKLREMSGNLIEELHTLEEDIYREADEPFNINSTQQLSVVLFEKLLPPARLKEMGLPQPKRTKTGFSTDASVLEELRDANPIVERVLRYRELTKLKSTYLDALPDLVNPKTGRVHTSYNQVGSATGRFSSSDPNLQNIPVRTDLGREMRRAFLAEPGWQLLAADYSQVELRVLAHLSQDPGLLAAFQRDEDIHVATAAQVYSVPPAEVTPDMRRIAKVMNFGIIYGLSAHGIAQQTDLDVKEGAAFIESYLGRYPGISDYVEATKQHARERGYVETILGRRRYLPEIRQSNFHVRQAAERMAINMPVQGGAADVIKIAMVRIHDRMAERGVKSRMLLQVHDELIFEVPPEEMDLMKETVLELMPSALELSVSLKIDLKVGPTWGDLE
ncbi:MAG: DNA polymerase I [Chloroflexi bacterium]|nr:DNA polymerase I [Chloroflexota bacterium]